MPASARVVSCYEAGRDGFWLHRHLRSVGIENEEIHSRRAMKRSHLCQAARCACSAAAGAPGARGSMR